MGRSKKENLQNEKIWWSMGAEIIFLRELFGHMLKYQAIIPKNMWVHPHLDIIGKRIDRIRWIAEGRMMNAGGFSPQVADDCFYPPWYTNEREEIKKVLEQALKSISEIVDNSIEKYHKENEAKPPDDTPSLMTPLPDDVPPWDDVPPMVQTDGGIASER